MPLLGCSHRPRCPITTSRWRCGQRTAAEQAVKDGVITRAAATSLLAHYGLPITPVSVVYRGERPTTGPTQQPLT